LDCCLAAPKLLPTACFDANVSSEEFATRFATARCDLDVRGYLNGSAAMSGHDASNSNINTTSNHHPHTPHAESPPSLLMTLAEKS